MDIVSAVIGLITLGVQLLEKAKTASAEKQAAIAAAVQAAKALLSDALADAHAARVEESAATAAAIAAAKTPEP